jgi:hypothetical protein
MTYTAHPWVEYAGTGSQKATWLNNTETQYTAIVDYCDTTTHDLTYYLKAEADAKYYNAGNDGSGSGFVIEYLDGYTGDELLAAGVASYFICIWNGSVASIPSGWHLCDGRNSYTPDLRGRFVVGAGGTYTVGATGGASAVTSAGTVTIGGHAVTTGEIPNHAHGGITDNYNPTNTSGRAGDGVLTGASSAASDFSTTTATTGSSATHTHTGSTLLGLGAVENNMPAYYALAYIIKEP